MEALLKPDVRLYLREVGIDITNAEFIFDAPWRLKASLISLTFEVVDFDGSGKLEYKAAHMFNIV